MKVVANKRDAQGTSASRRLRHAGKVPGVLYGGSGVTDCVIGNQEVQFEKFGGDVMREAKRVLAVYDAWYTDFSHRSSSLQSPVLCSL